LRGRWSRVEGAAPGALLVNKVAVDGEDLL